MQQARAVINSENKKQIKHMKAIKMISLVIIATLLAVFNLQAQTTNVTKTTNAVTGAVTTTTVVTPAPAPPATMPPLVLPILPTNAAASTNLGQVLGLPAGITAGWNTFLSGLVDASPYISNDIVNVDVGMLYNSSDKHGKVGAYLGASVPTSQQTAIGIGGFYLDNHFGNATVNLQLGTTMSNVFLLGKVYTFIASGPDYDFSKDPLTGKAYGIGAYNAAGFEKSWDFGGITPGVTPKWYQGWIFAIKAGVFNLSQVQGVGEFVGPTLQKHW
jgi:hypothetical protein